MFGSLEDEQQWDELPWIQQEYASRVGSPCRDEQATESLALIAGSGHNVFCGSNGREEAPYILIASACCLIYGESIISRWGHKSATLKMATILA